MKLVTRLSLAMVAVSLGTLLVMVVLQALAAEREFRALSPLLRELLTRTEEERQALFERAQPFPLLCAQLERFQGRLDELRAVADDFRRARQRSLVVTGLASSLLAVALALWLARRIARPLEHISQAAGRIAAGDLSARAPTRSGSQDEVSQLSANFNAMAESLARHDVERRAMVASIAHELRTPLAVMQGRLEAIEDGVMPLNLAEIHHLHEQTALLARLVEDLRTLSLADAGKLSLKCKPTDLGALAAQVHQSFRQRAEGAGVRLELTLPETPLWCRVDPDRIAQVLANLLDNALQHTPKGGWVRLELAARHNGVQLRVRDSGPGLPAGDPARLFDRFYRAGEGGSGLGLAIVKVLVELHGGSVRAADQAEGGAVFTLELPGG